jgi:hypothetical protein
MAVCTWGSALTLGLQKGTATSGLDLLKVLAAISNGVVLASLRDEGGAARWTVLRTAFGEGICQGLPVQPYTGKVHPEVSGTGGSRT